MSAPLKLTRKAPVMEIQHRGTFDVLVDDKGVGSIESDGDTIETPVAPGRHTPKSPRQPILEPRNSRFR